MKKSTGFLIIVIAVIALALVMSGKFFTIAPIFSFAGFSFTDAGEKFSAGCGAGGGQSDISVDGTGFLNMKAQASSTSIARVARTEITGIDEVLVIYEGSASGYCSLGGSNAGAGIGASVNSETNPFSDIGIGAGKSSSTSTCPSSSGSVSGTFAPSIWKFKNNFDGTWSYLESIGVGDIFIERQRAVLSGTHIYLNLIASAGGSCGQGGGGNSYLKVYNIVRKVNGFAQCKADEYVAGIDANGNIICQNFTAIKLMSEEAIKEDYNAKIARITADLTAKNLDLSTQIQVLQQQVAQNTAPSQIASLQQQITGLQTQLKAVNDNLAAVQARDTNVINTINANAQFQKPNFIVQFFDYIIAWIKGLFR